MVLYGIFLNNIKSSDESLPLTAENLDRYKAYENDIDSDYTLSEFDELTVLNSELNDDENLVEDSSIINDTSDISSISSFKDDDISIISSFENDDISDVKGNINDIDEENLSKEESSKRQENKRRIDEALKEKLPQLVDSFLTPKELQDIDVEFEKQLTKIGNLLSSLNTDLEEKIQQHHDVSNTLANDKDILKKVDEAEKKAIEAAKLDSKKQEEVARQARQDVIAQESNIVRLIKDECNTEINTLTQQVNDKIEDNKKRARSRQEAQNDLASQIKDLKTKKKANTAERANAKRNLEKSNLKLKRAELVLQNAKDASSKAQNNARNKFNQAKKEQSVMNNIYKKAEAKENKDTPFLNKKIDKLQKAKENLIKIGKQQELQDRDELAGLKLEVKEKKDKLIEQREKDIKEAQENAGKELKEQTEKIKHYHTKYEAAKNAKNVQDIGQNELAQGYQAFVLREKELKQEIKFLKNAIHKYREFQKNNIKSKDLFNKVKQVKDDLVKSLDAFIVAPSRQNAENIKIKAYDLDCAIKDFTKFSANNHVMNNLVKKAYNNCSNIFCKRVCKYAYVEKIDGVASKVKSDIYRIFDKFLSKVKHQNEFVYNSEDFKEIKSICVEHICCPAPDTVLIGINSIAADISSELGALGLLSRYPSIFQSDAAIEGKRSDVVLTSELIKNAQALIEQGEDRAKQNINKHNNIFNKDTLKNIEESQERSKRIEASIDKNAVNYSEKLNDYEQVKLDDNSDKLLKITYGSKIRNSAKAKILRYHQRQGISGKQLLLNNFTNEDVRMIGFKDVEQIKNANKEGLVDEEGEFTNSKAIITAAEKGFVSPMLLGVANDSVDNLAAVIDNKYLDPITGTYFSSKSIDSAKEEGLLNSDYKPNYFDELREDVIFAQSKKEDVKSKKEIVSGVTSHLKINMGSIMYSNIKKINGFNIAGGIGSEFNNTTFGVIGGILMDYKLFQSMIIINPIGINVYGIINGSTFFDPSLTINIGGKIKESVSVFVHINLSRTRGWSFGLNFGMPHRNALKKFDCFKKFNQMNYCSVSYIL